MYKDFNFDVEVNGLYIESSTQDNNIEVKVSSVNLVKRSKGYGYLQS
jgi:hypothetical protein